MNLCSYGHEEVCYEGRDCPACKILDELKDANKGLDADADEIATLKDRIKELEDSSGN